MKTREARDDGGALRKSAEAEEEMVDFQEVKLDFAQYQKSNQSEDWESRDVNLKRG